ncbi:MAG: hypothetical protein COU68_02740 [Candidatus Pacebacteria bacterium CG10_big_fil_rev_8_21_14_0_10_45_6]|nr:MAG: hypothetical protein COU68_02740 [Candidatus Pacebacteria bacterium CG10_big_fil_rev_8_21_14_0_10_45_6]
MNNLETQLEVKNTALSEVYADPNYITLYRFENPNKPFNQARVGEVSELSIVGMWFTDSIEALATYCRQRISGQPGGRFLVCRVKREDLEQHRASAHPEAKTLDIESDNFIIPPEIASLTQLIIAAPWKPEWEGTKNLPLSDYGLVSEFVIEKLSPEALIRSCQKIE